MNDSLLNVYLARQRFPSTIATVSSVLNHKVKIKDSTTNFELKKTETFDHYKIDPKCFFLLHWIYVASLNACG